MSNVPNHQDFHDAARKGFDEYQKIAPGFGGSFEAFVSGFCSGAEFASIAAQKILSAEAANICLKKIGAQSK